MKRVFAIFLVFICSHTNAQWIGAVVDTLTSNSESDEVYQNALDIDASGNLHIVYSRRDFSNNNIFYRMRDINNVWTLEDSIAIGDSPALIASNIPGEAFITYIGTVSNTQEVFVCSNSAGTWSSQQITFDSDEDISPTIAKDSSGFLNLSWIRNDGSGNYYIKYATNRSGSWAIQQLNASQLGMFGAGGAPQIGVENNGIAHIAYRGDNGNGYRIHHAYNNAPGDSTWSFDILSTPNDEDMSCSIVVKDTVTHLLISGDDGFGMPVEAFYRKKSVTDTTFSPSDFVAQNYRGGVGDLFIDNDGQPHVVLNEINGNFYTGNIIYANPNSWNGILLINSGDMYGANLVLDEQDNAYLAAYRGLALNDEEIIVYGKQPTAGINDPNKHESPCRLIVNNDGMTMRIMEGFTGRLACLTIEGKIIFNESRKFIKGETMEKKLSAGFYLFTSENQGRISTERFIIN